MKILNHYKNLSKEVYILALSKLVNTLGAFIWPLFTLILSINIGLEEGEIATYVLISTGLGLVSSLAGGYLSDHFGKKRSILTFQFFAILGYTIIIFIPIGMGVVYLLLFSQIMWGLSGPANDALLANVTKTEERESAFGLNYLALNVGIIIGPAVGSFLLRNNFTLFIGIDVVTSIASYLLLLFYVKEKEEKVVTNEMEEEVKVSVFRILKDRPVVLFYSILAMMISFAYGQLNFTLPLFVESLFEEGEKIFGIMYSINGATVVLSVAVLTYLLRKVNALQKIAIGFLLYILTHYLFAFNTTMVSMFVLIFIFTIGEVIISIGTSPLLSKIVPENLLGRITGLLYLFYTAGHGLAVFLGGRLLANELPFSTIWIVVGSCSVLGFIYFIWFYSKYKVLFKKVDSLEQNRQLD